MGNLVQHIDQIQQLQNCRQCHCIVKAEKETETNLEEDMKKNQELYAQFSKNSEEVIQSQPTLVI